MLRVNLLEDPTFRKDLLDMARGLLRGITETVIADTRVGEFGEASHGFDQGQRLDVRFPRSGEEVSLRPVDCGDVVSTGLRVGLHVLHLLILQSKHLQQMVRRHAT